MKKTIMLLIGMVGFMIIFPTTFWVALDGANLIQKVTKQMYFLVGFL